MVFSVKQQARNLAIPPSFVYFVQEVLVLDWYWCYSTSLIFIWYQLI